MTLPFSHRSARTRLTLLYFGLFLALGTVMLVLVYVFATGSSSVSAEPAPGNGPVARTLVVPSILTQHSRDQAALLTASWVVLLVAAAMAALLGWLAAKRVLRPVHQIATTAQTISAGNLHERLSLPGPDQDEFKQLGDTLDDLFARLETSFEAQRRFVANASHELRTPLTLDRTLLQLALSDSNASVEKLRATCEELLASGRDQERLLEALLTLASSERGLETRVPVDLSALAQRTLAARETELRIDSRLGDAVVDGDPALLERLVSNLVDNAIEHNLPGGELEVGTSTEDDRAVLRVSNTGRLIAAHDIERLFEPFERRAAGDGHHGLGLSIVRAIADAHGAAVTAQPRPSGGLEMTVRF